MPYVTRDSTATPECETPWLKYLDRDADKLYGELGKRLRRRYGSPLARVLAQRMSQLLTEEDLRSVPWLPRTVRFVEPKPPCFVVGCGEEQLVRSLCRRHYSRWDWWVGVSGRGARKDPRRQRHNSQFPRELQDFIIEHYERFVSGHRIQRAVEEAWGFRPSLGAIFTVLRTNDVRIRRRNWRGSTRHLPQQLTATMLWLYEDCGWSVEQIAEWRGVQGSTVSHHLRYNGVIRRPRSPYVHLYEEWQELSAEGVAATEIARRYGVHESTVRTGLKGGKKRTDRDRRLDREAKQRKRDRDALKSGA